VAVGRTVMPAHVPAASQNVSPTKIQESQLQVLGPVRTTETSVTSRLVDDGIGGKVWSVSLCLCSTYH
jgi:hypothetical protein